MTREQKFSALLLVPDVFIGLYCTQNALGWASIAAEHHMSRENFI